MRNFEERKAEIFSRSENRIKERRRKRNRILALCVPLCLCVVILSVVYMPKINLFSYKNSGTEYNDIAEGIDSNSKFTFTSLKVLNNISSSENTKTYTDKEEIENIYNLIQSAFTSQEDQDDHIYDEFTTIHEGETSTKGEKPQNTNPTSTTENYNKVPSYTITFTNSIGTETVYTLYGNLLTNNYTRNEITLTEDQLSKIMKLLNP